MNQHESVKQIVIHFMQAYASRDIDACMRLIAADKPLLIFGTNADEIFKTADEVRQSLIRDFGVMSNVRWGDVKHIAIETDQNLATAMIELPVRYVAENKEEKTMFRYAFVLRFNQNAWQIVNAMASVPAAAGAYSFTSWD